MYRISKGSHYSTCELPSFHLWNNNTFVKAAVFYGDCLYDDSGDDGWINKLYGISQGFPHQPNYLLFGWRSRKDKGGIELLPYRHVRWQKTYWASDENPYIVKPGTRVTLMIDTTDPKYYTFKAESPEETREWKLEREFKPWFPIGYTLKPYFGGQPTAPHDMHIILESQ